MPCVLKRWNVLEKPDSELLAGMTEDDIAYLVLHSARHGTQQAHDACGAA